MRKKRAQVWVETVIYTLIAFSLIGVAISMVKPKIESIQDHAILEQTINILQGIDNTIFEVEQTGKSNKRMIEITLKKGLLNIDAPNNLIYFELKDSPEPYSEPGEPVTNGDVLIETEQVGEVYNIKIFLNYSEKYDILFQETDNSKLINPSQRPYTFFIENQGEDEEKNKLKINFEVI